MTSSIDPIRRAAQLRRAQRTGEPDTVDEAEGGGLPVPVDEARTVPPRPSSGASGVFAAQLLGQDGQKRGLRAGPGMIDSAKNAYNRAEWSGSKDRRARRGGMTETDI